MATFAPAPVGDAKGTGEDRSPPLRPRETIGDLLRRTRVEYGAEIETIAGSLRIRAAYLTAIEQARYDRLPGSVYALGFVRAYATHLGLDGEEAVRRFKQEGAGLERRRDLSFPVPLTPRSVPGGRMLLAASVLAICAYGIWHYLSTGDRNRPERVAAVPSALLPAVPAPAAVSASSVAPAAAAVPAAPPAAAVDQAAPSVATPGASAVPAAATVPPAVSPVPSPAAAAAPSADRAAPGSVSTAPAPGAALNALAPRAAPEAPPAKITVAELPPPPASPTQAAPAMPAPAPSSALTVPALPAPVGSSPPVPAPPVVALAPSMPAAAAPAATGGRVFGAIEGPSHITLRAIQDCWIMVRDNDAAQTVVAQRTLHAGDTYRVPDRSGLVLRTGNATGLEVVVDGRVAPALGGTIRNVALDPGRLLQGTAHLE